MASKRKEFLKKFELLAIKTITKTTLSFDEKRIELDKHFNNHSSISKGHRKDIEDFLFGKFKNELSNEIIEHFKLKEYLSELDIPLFIIFIGSDFIRKDFKNINKKIKAFNNYKKIEARDSLSKKTIEDVFENFHQHSLARKRKRQIIYNCGPTNSGKTWGAMQDLIKAENGCYLAPLRLLAWEKFEELNQRHLTALITGEESNKPDGYTHSASTIEMANFNKDYKVAVIDEIQMIGDKQRGWAWTKALINIQTEKLYLCGDDSAIELVQKISDMCGDELTIIRHERKSSLSFLTKPIQEKDIEKGDAIVVFSRKEALNQKQNFEKLGFKVSIIYGLMTPEVRKEQARLFLEGITDIVISTDAIGMGLNLPIKRVIFSTIIKYFDKQEHVLSTSEIKQIAGRAGRYGLYPEGFVGLLDQKLNIKWSFKKHLDDSDITSNINSDNIFMLNKIKASLQQTLAPLKKATVGPDVDVLKLLNSELSKNNHEIMNVIEFIYIFNKIKTKEIFIKADLKDIAEQAEMIHFDLPDDIHKNEKYLEDIFKFVVAPIMLQQEDHVLEFQRLYHNFFNNKNSSFREINPSFWLDSCELDLKCIELYQWLKNQFEYNFNDSLEDIEKTKSVLINKINEFLIKN